MRDEGGPKIGGLPVGVVRRAAAVRGRGRDVVVEAERPSAGLAGARGVEEVLPRRHLVAAYDREEDGDPISWFVRADIVLNAMRRTSTRLRR